MDALKLGIWFSKDMKEMVTLNFDERLCDMKKLLFIWNARNLSLKGRITIIKSLVLPKITFLLSLIYVPTDILDNIHKILFDFLWRYKTPKVKKETITGLIEDGGLKMVDVHKMNIAAKCSWKRRLSCSENQNSKILFLKMLSINESMLNKKLGSINLANCHSLFHKQILQSWDEFYGVKSISKSEIYNEYLLYNKQVTIGKRHITINQLPNKYGYNLKLLDIFDEHGFVLKREELNKKLESNISQLLYNCVLTAIPSNWKIKVANKHQNNVERWPENVVFHVNDRPIPVQKVTSKFVYAHLIKQKTKPPTSLNVWIDLYPFLEKINWSDIFQLPYKITKEAYIHGFQYKILNRILNCNYNLHKWGIKDSPQCIFCTSIDTIQHHLYECEECKNFWKSIEDWIYEKLKVRFNFAICEIIFGFPSTDDPIFQVLNFIIIYAKHYINNKRSNTKKPLFVEFICIIKEKVNIFVEIENNDNIKYFFNMLLV